MTQVNMAGMAAAARGSARFPIVLRLHPTVPNRLAAGWETVCLRDRAAWDAAVVARQLGRLERTDPRLNTVWAHFSRFPHKNGFDLLRNCTEQVGMWDEWRAAALALVQAKMMTRDALCNEGDAQP